MANDKVLILGVDGLDPSLLCHYREQGKLPNFDRFIKAGSTRKDLRMLGPRNSKS
mgnify:CR=1 FL=1